ncbi:hypothetical protein Hanom_Chr10g00911471 [Helianthus anomalus]
MNTVTIFEAKLHVFVAKFDKDNSKFRHTIPRAQPRLYNPTPQTQNRYKYVPKERINGVSFADVVNEKPGKEANSVKVVAAEERIAVYPDHCLMQSVIVELRDVTGLEEIRTMLELGGYMESPVCYLGGLKCMIVFKEKRLDLQFIEKEVSAWRSVEGVPIHLHDNKLFDRVGGLFGTVAGGSEFSWAVPENSCGRCWILTETGKRIYEEIVVTWFENKYRVWVSEEHNSRLDAIIKELSSTTQTSPAKSVDSCAGNFDDKEEGEFVREEVECQMESNRVLEKTDGVQVERPELRCPLTPTGRVIGNTSANPGGNDGSDIEGLHGNSESLHAEHEQVNYAQTPMAATHVHGGSNSAFNSKVDNPFKVGSGKLMGQRQDVRSRKRARCTRSPNAQDLEEGNKWAHDFNINRGCKDLFDLNNPALNSQSNINTSVTEEQRDDAEIEILVHRANMASNGGVQSEGDEPPHSGCQAEAEIMSVGFSP